ncbi:MAG: APC family permease [Gemmatimonadota bacterium]
MREQYGRLLRVLGIAFGWAVTVGTTIGAGILRTPGEVALHAPTHIAFFAVWLAGGAYALLGALTLAELGTMIPESGGQTLYARRAFGVLPGFMVAWSDWLSSSASAALITIVLVQAVSAIVPETAHLERLLAVLIILAFAAGQWRGVRTSSTLQLTTTTLKALAFIVLIAACFLTPAPPSAEMPGAAPVALTLAGVMISLQAMVYTYDGWASVLYFSGEVRDAGRDIPRSMISGVLSVLAIYLLVNAAFLHLIPLRAMAGDPLVADTAAALVFGSAGTTVIRVLIAVSLLSAINACMLEATRVLYAAGATRVNEGGTPTAALAISTAVAVILVSTGTFNQVIALAAFFFVANYSVSFAALFRLRHTEPAAERPYRAWGYPITPALVLAASLGFLIAAIVADPRNSAYAVLLLAASYPVHRLLPRKRG